MRAVESRRVRSVGVRYCDELVCDADTWASLMPVVASARSFMVPPFLLTPWARFRD